MIWRVFSVTSLISALIFAACEDSGSLSSNPDLLSNEIVYALSSSTDDYNVHGIIAFSENDDNALTAEVILENTSAGSFHPVHIHYGPLNKADTTLAFQLNPVDGATGESITTFNRLLNGDEFNFADLLSFDGSVKVHLDAGPNRNIILAATNIGKNTSVDDIVANCSDKKDG